MIDVTSILSPQTPHEDEVRTEAMIVLRTVEHITFDLDYFSRTIRHRQFSPTIIADIEGHLAQARRNCAEATTIAEHILQVDTGDEFRQATQMHSEQIRDAFSLLTLADSAYLRAYEVAGAK